METGRSLTIIAILCFCGYCLSLGPGPGIIFAFMAFCLVPILIGFGAMATADDSSNCGTLPVTMPHSSRTFLNTSQEQVEMLTYPATFPSDAITSLVQMIESPAGIVDTLIPQAGLDVWNVQGYVQSIVLGNPGVPASKASAPAAMSHKDGLACLKQMNEQSSYQAVMALNFDWSTLLQWLITIIQDILTGKPITIT